MPLLWLWRSTVVTHSFRLMSEEVVTEYAGEHDAQCGGSRLLPRGTGESS
jgi:hypothetical protein